MRVLRGESRNSTLNMNRWSTDGESARQKAQERGRSADVTPPQSETERRRPRTKNETQATATATENDLRAREVLNAEHSVEKAASKNDIEAKNSGVQETLSSLKMNIESQASARGEEEGMSLSMLFAIIGEVGAMYGDPLDAVSDGNADLCEYLRDSRRALTEEFAKLLDATKEADLQNAATLAAVDEQTKVFRAAMEEQRKVFASRRLRSSQRNKSRGKSFAVSSRPLTRSVFWPRSRIIPRASACGRSPTSAPCKLIVGAGSTPTSFPFSATSGSCVSTQEGTVLRKTSSSPSTWTLLKTRCQGTAAE